MSDNTIQVPDQTVLLGLQLGLMRRAEDGVVELTEKGESVLREHLAKYANQPKGR